MGVKRASTPDPVALALGKLLLSAAVARFSSRTGSFGSPYPALSYRLVPATCHIRHQLEEGLGTPPLFAVIVSRVARLFQRKGQIRLLGRVHGQAQTAIAQGLSRGQSSPCLMDPTPRAYPVLLWTGQNAARSLDKTCPSSLAVSAFLMRSCHQEYNRRSHRCDGAL